jgi:hypothetical protein
MNRLSARIVAALIPLLQLAACGGTDEGPSSTPASNASVKATVKVASSKEVEVAVGVPQAGGSVKYVQLHAAAAGAAQHTVVPGSEALVHPLQAVPADPNTGSGGVVGVQAQ